MTEEADRGETPPPISRDVLTMRQVLELPIFAKAVILAGHNGLGRGVHRLNVMTTPDILRWARPNEFMLSTDFPLPHSVDGLITLVEGFANIELAGLGVKLGHGFPELPAEVIKRANEIAFPLVQIPDDLPIDDVLETVLSEIVNRQALRIAQSAAIHDAFLDIALSGGGLPEITAKLSGLLSDSRVAIVDSTGTVLTDTGCDDLDATLLGAGFAFEPGVAWPPGMPLTTQVRVVDDVECVLAPIRAGGVTHGRIVSFRAHGSANTNTIVAVEQAAVVAALDINRQIAMAAVERHFESNLLHDLVTGSPGSIPETLARGASFGWRLDNPVVVVVCRPEWSASRDGDVADRQIALQRYITMWSSKVRNQDRGAAVAGFTDELVAVLDASPSPKTVGTRLWNAMHSLAVRSFSVGVSRTVERPEDIPHGYEEAHKALSNGQRISGPGNMTSFEDLGLFRLLSLIEDSELSEFLDETLADLLRLESEEQADLLHTLEVLLDVQLNVAEASRRTHYHYNTMRYRISKLERLVGPFTTDGALCLRLSVALQILQMQQVPGRGVQRAATSAGYKP